MAADALIPPEAAWQRIEAGVAPLAAEPVARRQAAGRVLARPLRSTIDVPACDVSAMDGYALAGAVEPGARRPVAGVIAAGDAPGFELPAAAAVRIMTGAPVPAGADRVVPVELTDGGSDEVVFNRGTVAGRHIRRRREIQSVGDPLLPAGQRLGPGALALLATHGHEEVEVHRLPRVAALSTGDEVVAPDREPGPGQLRDSHTDFLLAACRSLGVPCRALGIAPDRREAIAERVRDGIESDVLLVCGGVSMGEFDFVEEVLADAGCEPLFTAVALQPGKPLVAARHPGGWVFGLPGNPASAMVTFWLFVKPLLRRLSGEADAYWQGALRGELAAELPGAKDRARFLPAQVEIVDGSALVTPLPPKGSHDVAAYGVGNAIVRVPAHAAPAGRGAPCEAMIVGRGW